MLTTVQRRNGYARQAGADPAAYTPTAAQARRIRAKQRRRGATPARLAASITAQDLAAARPARLEDLARGLLGTRVGGKREAVRRGKDWEVAPPGTRFKELMARARGGR